jgi:hypothetical protein
MFYSACLVKEHNFLSRILWICTKTIFLEIFPSLYAGKAQSFAQYHAVFLQTGTISFRMFGKKRQIFPGKFVLICICTIIDQRPYRNKFLFRSSWKTKCIPLHGGNMWNELQAQIPWRNQPYIEDKFRI